MTLKASSMQLAGNPKLDCLRTLIYPLPKTRYDHSISSNTNQTLPQKRKKEELKWEREKI